ncbi:MAG TPA: O-methyltransferase [Bacteroidales bacterium]|nr:O-methyltransferase [Bacteroidales bacterium]HPT52258.1 O-methyltransferase [Bacteroidales bacterium]
MHAEITQEIEEYCEAHSTPENDLLNRLDRETNLKVLRPRMISGHLQGAFLSFISRLLRPTSILEIGTYTGYAALCLAEGLSPDGTLDTIEIDEELEDIIQKYFNQSRYKEQIILHIGDARTIIPTLNKKWDLVFIDAEKKEYFDYYEAILPHIQQGGIILIDNVLWSGKVIQEVKENDKDTQSIIDFNKYIQNDQRVRNLLLPLRDGIMIIEKL